MKTEFEHLMSMDNIADYLGKWIAMVDSEVVSKGDNGKEVYAEAKKKFPNREVFIMKVPADTVMLL